MTRLQEILVCAAGVIFGPILFTNYWIELEVMLAPHTPYPDRFTFGYVVIALVVIAAGTVSSMLGLIDRTIFFGDDDGN